MNPDHLDQLKEEFPNVKDYVQVVAAVAMISDLILELGPKKGIMVLKIANETPERFELQA